MGLTALVRRQAGRRVLSAVEDVLGDAARTLATRSGRPRPAAAKAPPAPGASAAAPQEPQQNQLVSQEEWSEVTHSTG